MLDHINVRKVLFLDIETVPAAAQFSDLSDEMQKLWTYRTNRFKPEDITAEDYYFKKAGVYAEFGKIICISVGFFAKPEALTNKKNITDHMLQSPNIKKRILRKSVRN